MANLLTILRIILSPLLLFLSPLSPSFFSFYLLLGLTDILDGIIARKTNSVTRLGAIFDSIGDILFLASAFLSIYPFLKLSLSTIILIGIIFILRVLNLIVGLKREKKVIFLHTKANKVTGLLLFIFPLTISYFPTTISCFILSLIALYASINEWYLIWRGRTQDN